MDKLVYSNTVNLIEETEVTLWSVWRDSVLVGLAPQGQANIKRWVKPGDMFEIGNQRWAMLRLAHGEDPASPDYMLHLLAVD